MSSYAVNRPTVLIFNAEKGNFGLGIAHGRCNQSQRESEIFKTKRALNAVVSQCRKRNDRSRSTKDKIESERHCVVAWSRSFGVLVCQTYTIPFTE